LAPERRQPRGASRHAPAHVVCSRQRACEQAPRCWVLRVTTQPCCVGTPPAAARLHSLSLSLSLSLSHTHTQETEPPHGTFEPALQPTHEQRKEGVSVSETVVRMRSCRAPYRLYEPSCGVATCDELSTALPLAAPPGFHNCLDAPSVAPATCQALSGRWTVIGAQPTRPVKMWCSTRRVEGLGE
jgi:hypothetical protein